MILMKPRVFTKFGMMHWAVMEKNVHQNNSTGTLYTYDRNKTQVTGTGVTMQVGLHNDVGCFFLCVCRLRTDPVLRVRQARS